MMVLVDTSVWIDLFLDRLFLVHITTKSDNLNIDNSDSIINGIDDSAVTDPHPITALKMPAERLDTVMPQGIFSEPIKGGVQTTNRCGIRLAIEFSGLLGKLYFIHHGESLSNSQCCRCGYLLLPPGNLLRNRDHSSA